MGLGPAIEPDARIEGVRLGNFLDRFQMAAAIRKGEDLARAAGANRLDGDPVGGRPRAVLEGKPEAGRHAALEDFKGYGTGQGLDPMGRVMRMGVLVMVVTV